MNEYQQLMQLAARIENVELPDCTSDLAVRICDDVKTNLRLVAAHLRVDAGILAKQTNDQ